MKGRKTGRFCPVCHRTYPQEKEYCPLDGAELKPLPQEIPKDVPVELNQRYLLLSVLGKGGMGVIYRGHDMEVGSPVAVKVLRPELTSNELSIQRFFIEARAAKRLNHPNIVQVHDYGVSSKGYLFITMELLWGRSLAAILDAKKRLDVRFALMVAIAVAKALDHAHGKGVVHRDLKPDNIMVLDFGDEIAIKVLDFGVAAVLDAKDRGLLYKGEVIGTPAYMSPEQVRGKQVDGRSDLYALGILMFEMLKGRVPFIDSDPFETMKMHLNNKVPSLGVIDAPYWLSSSLDSLIKRLLAKQRDERPRDAALVYHALERLLARYEAENGEWDPKNILANIKGNVEATDIHSAQTLILPGGDRRLYEQKTLMIQEVNEHELTRINGFNQELPTLVMSQQDALKQGMKTVDGVWTISSIKGQSKLPEGKETILISLMHAILEFDDNDSYRMLGTRDLFRPEIESFERLVMSKGGLICFDTGDVIRIVFGLLENPQSPPRAALDAAEEFIVRVKRFAKGTARAMRVKIGVATGRIPKKSFSYASPDESLRGSAVDIAQRLASMAPGFGIFTDKTTVQLSVERFSFHRIGKIRIRGHQAFDDVYKVKIAV